MPAISRRELHCGWGLRRDLCRYLSASCSRRPGDHHSRRLPRVVGKAYRRRHPPDLDPAAAARLLDGFVSTGRGPGLATSLPIPMPRAGPLADDIVAAWYSGIYDTATGPAVAAFNDALLWDALDFTKPSGACGGETGYWADPPRSLSEAMADIAADVIIVGSGICRRAAGRASSPQPA